MEKISLYEKFIIKDLIIKNKFSVQAFCNNVFADWN